MDFPIVDLLDEELSTAWLVKHFHPNGLCCPRCGTDHRQAYLFRRTRRSDLQVYRCKHCAEAYTLYSGTLFEGRHLRPSQTLLLRRGVVQGVSAAQLARELCMNRTTVHEIRRQLQQNAVALQAQHPLPDDRTETDEMVQNAGEKRPTPC